MRIGIVGAGMAGLACAEGLTRREHDVVLFDKGRGPGGRMSTRRIATSAGEAFFDHGAQYFSVRDAAFGQRVEAWISQGVAAPWPSAGSDAFVGVPAMNSAVRQMAVGLSVHRTALVTRIESLGRGWRLILDQGEAVEVDIAVVATPAEQASALLASIAPRLAARARATPSAPCWTAMLAFPEPVAVAQNCWRGVGAIGWAARNNSKPGRRVGSCKPARFGRGLILRQTRIGSPTPSKGRYRTCWALCCLPLPVNPASGGALRDPARRGPRRYSIAIAVSESAATG